MLQPSGPSNTPCSGWRLKILWPAFRRLEIAETIRSSSAPTIGALISLQRNLAPGTEFLRPETKRLNRPFSLPSDRVAHIVRHTTPANAAFSREVSENAKFRECVVVCAVKYEPVSTHKFPIIREFNREFGPFSPLSASPEMKFQNKVKYLCRNSLCNIIGNYEQLIGNSKNRNGF